MYVEFLNDSRKAFGIFIDMLRKEHAIHFDNVTTFRNLKQASEAVKSFIQLIICKGALIFVHIKAELVNMLVEALKQQKC